MQRDDDGPGYEQQDLLDQELAWAMSRIAETAELVAKLGHCPERARDVERGLLEVAGLNEFNLAA